MSESKSGSSGGRNLIIGLAVLLAVIHQDFWWWDEGYLVFGFLPVGLAFHALFSLLAVGLWALAIKVAWPHHIEAMVKEPAEETTQEKDTPKA